MITRFFFNNRIGHVKARIKQLILIILLACGVRALMCRFYCSRWLVWNTVCLGRFSTELLYISLLVVAISCYNLQCGRKSWKKLLTVAFTPLMFFLSFCLMNNLLLILAALSLFIYSVIMDIKLVKMIYEDEGYTLADGRLELESLILEDLGVSVRYLGVFSMVMALLTLAPANDYFLVNPATVYAPEGCYRYSDVLNVGVKTADYSNATARSIVQGEIVYATNMRDLNTTTPTNLWEPNKDSLQQLAIGHYEQLDINGRIDALQELLNIEAEYLGCEPILLGVRELEYTTGGYYDGTRNEIIINSEWVRNYENSYGLIRVLLHEVYHYYSACCVLELDKLEASGINMDLLFVRDIRTWKAEQEDYINGSQAFGEDGSFDWQTYYEYNSQALETSADAYSELWLDPYWKFINSIETGE